MSESNADHALIESAVGGDIPTLERLLWTHFAALERHIAPKIPAAARKHFGVEDILQTVFAQAFRDIRKFEPRGDGAFLAWLRAIADHRLIDALRKLDHGKVHQISAVQFDDARSMYNLLEFAGSDSESPSKAVASKEATQAIQIALAGLPDDQQQAVRLNCLERKSVDEVAAITGRTEAAVRGLIHRGKKNLAEAMGRSSQWLSSR